MLNEAPESARKTLRERESGRKIRSELDEFLQVEAGNTIVRWRLGWRWCCFSFLSSAGNCFYTDGLWHPTSCGRSRDLWTQGCFCAAPSLRSPTHRLARLSRQTSFTTRIGEGQRQAGPRGNGEWGREATAAATVTSVALTFSPAWVQMASAVAAS